MFAAFAVNFTEPPEQNEIGPLAEILAVGISTDTFMGDEVPVFPFTSVTVTE